LSHASKTVEGAFSTYSSPPRATSAQNFRASRQAFLYAFDLLELDGTDLRREPIEVRKATLASIVRKSRPGVRLWNTTAG
jgi:ATP-dependent DNA ligase